MQSDPRVGAVWFSVVVLAVAGCASSNAGNHTGAGGGQVAATQPTCPGGTIDCGHALCCPGAYPTCCASGQCGASEPACTAGNGDAGTAGTVSPVMASCASGATQCSDGSCCPHAASVCCGGGTCAASAQACTSGTGGGASAPSCKPQEMTSPPQLVDPPGSPCPGGRMACGQGCCDAPGPNATSQCLCAADGTTCGCVVQGSKLVACGNSMTEPSVGGGPVVMYPLVCGGDTPACNDPFHQCCAAVTANAPDVTCNLPAQHYCLHDRSWASQYTGSGCKGQIVAACPTAGLVGCCTITLPVLVSEICVYPGADPNMLPTQATCPNLGGVWSTSP